MSGDLASELAAVLAGWDGRTTAGLEAFHRANGKRPDLLDLLLTELARPEESAPASWLIKHHLEAGQTPTGAQAVALCRAIPAARDWQTRLHLLQILALIDLPLAESERVLADVQPLLQEENKFIRAWAFNALGLLAKLRPDWQDAMTHRLERGLAEETGAVAARIRKALRG